MRASLPQFCACVLLYGVGRSPSSYYSLSHQIVPFFSPLLFQPFLRPHELPDPNWNVSKQVTPGHRVFRNPICFTTASIIVHAETCTFHLPPGSLTYTIVTAQSLRRALRFSSTLICVAQLTLLCFLYLCCPCFNIVSVVIPNTVRASAHATIIWL